MTDRTTSLPQRAHPAARFVVPVADLMALRSRPPAPQSFAAIIGATADAAGLRPADILGTCRKRQIAHPRQVAMALCRDLPGATLWAVAAAFRRDHTTVMHAERAVRARMTPDLEAAMQRIRERAGVAG